MQAQFHQQMQQMQAQMEARMQSQLQQIQATVQQQPIVMPPTIQPTMHSSYPPAAAAAAAPRAHTAASDSPAAGFTATWAQFKNFVNTSAPAAQRFKAHIVGAQQQEIDSLRAQVRTHNTGRANECSEPMRPTLTFVLCCCCRCEVARLSGVLLPDDPEYGAIVREARARFAKPGGEKLFQKREAKLTRLAGDLQSKEFLVSTLLREISTLRLRCVLYEGQVDLDKQQMGSIVQDKEQRIDRWEEQERASASEGGTHRA